MADKIRAATDARRSSDTVISARTDALYSSTMEESLQRAERYLEAGADMIFIEGCTTQANRQKVANSLSARAPLLFNAGILDQDALPGRAEFERLGYSMVLFPGSAVAAAARAMQRALAEVGDWAGAASPAPDVDLQAAIEADAFMTRFE